jgi:hypothetical protein
MWRKNGSFSIFSYNYFVSREDNKAIFSILGEYSQPVVKRPTLTGTHVIGTNRHSTQRRTVDHSLQSLAICSNKLTVIQRSYSRKNSKVMNLLITSVISRLFISYLASGHWSDPPRNCFFYVILYGYSSSLLLRFLNRNIICYVLLMGEKNEINLLTFF